MRTTSKNQLLELTNILHEYGLNVNTNEIYLESHMNGPDEEGIDYRCVAKFVKNFNLLDSLNDKPILIHLNSIGGDICQGLSIFDVIKQSKKHIYVLGYAEVASMASVVLSAADTRLILSNTTMMIHNASLTVTDIPTHGLRSYLKLLAEQEKFMLNVYAEKCVRGPFFQKRGYSLNKVKTYIKARITQNIDWYMGSEEALDLGFCDGIIGNKDYPSIDSVRAVSSGV